MIKVAEAIAQQLENLTPVCLSVSNKAIEQSLNAVCAETIVSPVAVPAFDNSAMDGFALRLADLENSRQLPLSQTIAAGQAATTLAKGSCARIFTGAVIPDGADIVIMQEQAKIRQDGVLFELGCDPYNVGQHIRSKGNDLKPQQLIVAKGTLITAAVIGHLASAGIANIRIFEPLRVAILSCGDELKALGEPLQQGQIYNSNAYLLSALCRQAGLTLSHIAHVQDSLHASVVALQQAAAKAHVVISSGGVSVGDKDFIKQALSNTGELQLHKVAIKPGKPYTTGVIRCGQHSRQFFGLPGNPNSVFCTFLILVLPVLKRLQGLQRYQPKTRLVKALFNKRSQSRQEYLRARQTEQGLVLHSNQSSGSLASAAWAEGFVVQNIEQTIATDELVEFLPFSECWH